MYFDYNSTAPTLPIVQASLSALFSEPLNASSIHHLGRKAKSIIEQSRNQLARLAHINAGSPYKIIFTSSGTESNNFIMQNFLDGEIFISAIEHASILSFAKPYSNVKIVNVNENGLIDCNHLEFLLSQSQASKKLVSIMFANNETGIIQPISEVREICYKYNAYLHSDCVQGLGKIEIDIPLLDLDFVSLSAHKFGGIFGCGALIAKNLNHLKPFLLGGGQEFGLRSSTENIIAINACGVAAEYISTNLPMITEHLLSLRNYFENNLSKHFTNTKIIGNDVSRLPNTSLVAMSGTSSEAKVISFDLKGVALSSGSACSSGKVSASHVLKAMNIPQDEAKSAIRISFGPNNTIKEIDQLITIWQEVYPPQLDIKLTRIA